SGYIHHTYPPETTADTAHYHQTTRLRHATQLLQDGGQVPHPAAGSHDAANRLLQHSIHQIPRQPMCLQLRRPQPRQPQALRAAGHPDRADVHRRDGLLARRRAVLSVPAIFR
ncbi:hypothetical protein V498_10116, partial [Pseudogymnoascus sp. VKM F-4517 (FW-2822)]